MLAKEVKIANIAKQRKFIQRQLEFTKNMRDGNPVYRYIGYVFPEVRRYFAEQGYEVRQVSNGQLDTATQGRPLYVFTPRDDIELTEEEFKEAESIAADDDVDDKDDDNPTVLDAIKAFINTPHPK